MICKLLIRNVKGFKKKCKLFIVAVVLLLKLSLLQ